MGFQYSVISLGHSMGVYSLYVVERHPAQYPGSTAPNEGFVKGSRPRYDLRSTASTDLK